MKMVRLKMAQGVGWLVGWLPTWEATAELSGSCSLPGSSRNRCKEKTQPKHCAGAISVMTSPLLWYASLVTKYIRKLFPDRLSCLTYNKIYTCAGENSCTICERERERHTHTHMDLAMAMQELWTLHQMTNHMMNLAEMRIQAWLNVSLCKHFV